MKTRIDNEKLRKWIESAGTIRSLSMLLPRDMVVQMAAELLERRAKEAEVAENLKRMHDLTEDDSITLPSGEVWAYRIHGGAYYSQLTSAEIPSNAVTDALFDCAVKGGAKVERMVRAEQ